MSDIKQTLSYDYKIYEQFYGICMKNKKKNKKRWKEIWLSKSPYGYTFFCAWPFRLWPHGVDTQCRPNVGVHKSSY